MAVLVGGVLALFFWQGNVSSLLSGAYNSQSIIPSLLNVTVALANAQGQVSPPPVAAKTGKDGIPTFEIFVNPPSLPTKTVSRGDAKKVSQSDLDLLARVIYAEARGEDFQGQVAVGAVVLNRLDAPRFPKTIRDVIYQPGAFTAVSDKQIYLQPDTTAYQAAEAALNGDDPTGGALYYYNPRTATDSWIKSRPVIKRIGNHTFST